MEEVNIEIEYHYVQDTFLNQLLSNFKCSICQEVLNTPIITTSCSHHFCKACLDSYQKSVPANKKSFCPNCRSPFTPLPLSPIEPILDTLLVRCLSKECPWTGNRSSLKSHLRNSCPIYFLCACSSLLKKEYQPMHVELCPEADLRCACGQFVKRKFYTNHLTDICVREILPCPCQPYGCEWTGRKQQSTELEQHMQQCLFRHAHRQIVELKQQVEQRTDITSSPLATYLQSEMVTIMGLDLRRKYPNNFAQRVQSILRTPEDLSTTGFQNVFDFQDGVKMEKYQTDRSTDSTFPEQDSSIRLDMHPQLGILAISMARRSHRFFIVPVQNKFVQALLAKKNSQLNLTFHFQNINSLKMVTPVFFASRKWTHYTCPDGVTRPIDFYVELTNCLITQFTFRCSSGRSRRKSSTKKKKNEEGKDEEEEEPELKKKRIEVETDHEEENKPEVKNFFTLNSLMEFFDSFFSTWNNMVA